MNKFLITILFLTTSFLFGQQLPVFSDFFKNEFIINPALTGVEKNQLNSCFRKQWSGFKGAPSTVTINGQFKNINKKFGLGFSAFIDDRGGAIKQTGIILNYNYFLLINKKEKITFGVSGIINQYSFDKNNISTLSLNDPSLYSSGLSIVPDINFGLAYINNNKLKIGLSVQQLIQNKLENFNQVNLNSIDQNKLIRHFNFSISYLNYLNKKIGFQYYSLVKTTFINPLQIDFGTKMIYNKYMSLGIAYRSFDAIIINLGFIKNNLTFGYNYDFTTSLLRKYSTGSHEIAIGYNFK